MNPDLPFRAVQRWSNNQNVVRCLHDATVRLLRAGLVIMSMVLTAGNAAADTPAAGSFAGGNGTQGDPWQISSLAELRRFMEDSSPGFFPRNSYYKLTANIDASDTATWFGGLGWLPVDATTMQGLDPAGFEIQNLRINRPTTDYVGFFGKFNSGNGPLANFKFVGGQIVGQDYVGTLMGFGNPLTISNSSSTATVSGRSQVGGLAGLASSTTINASSATGNVTGTGDIVGGLVGNAAGASVSSSSATGHVTGKKQVGGLAGVFTQGSGTGLTTSWASGKVDGDDLVGGLIGFSNSKVTFSYATGAVTATGSNPTNAGNAPAGGLIGQQGTARPTEDSWASGAVTGPLSGLGGLIGWNAGPIARSATLSGQTVTGTANASSVGGLVGLMSSGSITASRSASAVSSSGPVSSIGGLVGSLGAGTGISTSYATGSVTADGAIQVGGLVGWHTAGTITASHAQGNVLGMSNVGGLIGLSTNFAVTTSYATGTVYGTTLVGGLIGSRGTGLTDTTFATGTVTANGGDYAGGLIGLNSGTLKKSYATTGTVTGQKWVGGLVGYNPGSVETSYAIKDVSGTIYVGGLLGQTGSSSIIKDCYAKGAVSGSNQVGGLVGGNSNGSSITQCYASGTVPLFSATSVGGLIGDNQSGGVSFSYWNTLSTGSVSGIGTGPVTTGVTGRSATQMMMQTSFAGFVFPSPWRIDEGISQPYFDYGMTGQVATTTSLVSSVNPSVLGQNVTFTASLTPNTGTGTVLFQEGTTPLPGCVAVTVTAGQAQCAISTLAVGLHGISAVYSGDGGNLGSNSSTLSQNVIPPSLDIDASNTLTKYHAPTDGLLAVRYLFGLTGNSLVAGVAFGGTATRTDPVLIKSYLDAIRPLLDIDGSNNVNALTDGVLILRYLLGLSGDALISGAVDLQLGTRNTATDIQSYMQLLTP